MKSESSKEETESKTTQEMDDSSSMTSRDTMLHEMKNNVANSPTLEEQQFMHPLEVNDELAFKTIKTVRLDFVTEEVQDPVPRCQDLPPHAFSKINCRSILVSISHGWFFQMHPDPYGTKLDLIRQVFAPKLRERYPRTDIQVFFDYFALPQRPRTDQEDDTFRTALERMNSMFVYADVILCLDVDCPKVDMTVHAAKIDVSEYKFHDFIDTVQVYETTSKTGPQKLDCVLTCGHLKLKSREQIAKYSGVHDVTYHQRPYGRLNTIKNDDRGWLYLEHTIIAAKAAAADKSQFDDIVVSNTEKIRTKTFQLVEQLRKAARKQKQNSRLSDMFDTFHEELMKKQFAFSSDKFIAANLMRRLVNQFAKDWKGEVEKQKSMDKRAREILLRWGSFSEDYVERAEMLCDLKQNENMWWYLPIVVFSITVFAPIIAILPFTVSMEADGVDPSTDKMALLRSSVFVGCEFRYVQIFVIVSDFIVLDKHFPRQCVFSTTVTYHERYVCKDSSRKTYDTCSRNDGNLVLLCITLSATDFWNNCSSRTNSRGNSRLYFKRSVLCNAQVYTRSEQTNRKNKVLCPW